MLFRSEPTRIYTRSVMHCLSAGITIKGIVHITGGGFYENIPRILPDTTAARIDRSSFETPAIFNIIQKEGTVSDSEMFTTFNMGIGMMLFVDKNTADRTVEKLKQAGESPRVIGAVTSRDGAPVAIV